jgi:WD40 repeat protein
MSEREIRALKANAELFNVDVKNLDLSDQKTRELLKKRIQRVQREKELKFNINDPYVIRLKREAERLKIPYKHLDLSKLDERKKLDNKIKQLKSYNPTKEAIIEEVIERRENKGTQSFGLVGTISNAIYSFIKTRQFDNLNSNVDTKYDDIFKLNDGRIAGLLKDNTVQLYDGSNVTDEFKLDMGVLDNIKGIEVLPDGKLICYTSGRSIKLCEKINNNWTFKNIRTNGIIDGDLIITTKGFAVVTEDNNNKNYIEVFDLSESKNYSLISPFVQGAQCSIEKLRLNRNNKIVCVLQHDRVGIFNNKISCNLLPRTKLYINDMIILRNNHIALSSGNNLLIIDSEEGDIKTYTDPLQTIKFTKLLELSNGDIAAINGREVAVFKENKKINRFVGHTGDIYDIIQLDDSRIATSSDNGEVRIYDGYNDDVVLKASGKIYKIFQSKTGSIVGMVQVGGSFGDVGVVIWK